MNKWTLIAVAALASVATLWAVYSIGCKAGPDPAATKQAAGEQFVMGDNQLSGAAPALTTLKGSTAPQASAAVKSAADLAKANADLQAKVKALEDAEAKAAPGAPPSQLEGWVNTVFGFIPPPYNTLAALGVAGFAWWKKQAVANAAKNLAASIEHAKAGSAAFASAMSDPVVVGILDASQTPLTKSLVDAGQEKARQAAGVMPSAVTLSKAA